MAGKPDEMDPRLILVAEHLKVADATAELADVNTAAAALALALVIYCGAADIDVALVMQHVRERGGDDIAQAIGGRVREAGQ